jgi:hypothetical protein
VIAKDDQQRDHHRFNEALAVLVVIRGRRLHVSVLSFRHRVIAPGVVRMATADPLEAEEAPVKGAEAADGRCRVG